MFPFRLVYFELRGDKMKNVANTGIVYDSLYVRPGMVREGLRRAG